MQALFPGKREEALCCFTMIAKNKSLSFFVDNVLLCRAYALLKTFEKFAGFVRGFLIRLMYRSLHHEMECSKSRWKIVFKLRTRYTRPQQEIVPSLLRASPAPMTHAH